MTRLVLASASPRRRQLLAALVREFEVIPGGVDEQLVGDPVADARRLALAKAGAVARITGPAAMVLGSDTIVHDGARSYGKPETPAEAREMLAALAGRWHRVVTGVALVSNGETATSHSETAVELSPLTPQQIARYVASGRPMDKAGAYAIQDADVPTVRALRGCYCAVVGLGLWRTKQMLETASVPCLDPSATFEQCVTCPERT